MFNSLKLYGLQPARLLCHGIFRARVLEWVAMPYSKGSSWPTDRTRVSCLLHWHVDSLPLALPGKPLTGFMAYLNVKPKKKTLAPRSPQGLFFHYNLWCTKTDAKAETPVLWPPHAKSWLIGKDSDAGRDWGQEEKGTTEDEMAGWHHQLDGRESQWTPGVSDGQGGLACCDSWGRKESDTTERLNWTELKTDA